MIPFIGYFSYLKEYSIQEIEKYYKKKVIEAVEEPNPELQEIGFVKKLILKVNKHSYFSYIAITNTLIGEARESDVIKSLWLDRPSKYHFKTKNSTQTIINGSYSVNGRMSYIGFNMPGNKNSVDDIAKYTYQLFKQMGVWDQFKNKGEKAIDLMNSMGLLSHL